jgi:hypothetical protein
MGVIMKEKIVFPTEGFSEEENKVNWEEVAKRQECELTHLRDENESLLEKINGFDEKFNTYRIIIAYLEYRLENPTV